MDGLLIDSVPFKLDFTLLRKRAHVREGSPYLGELQELASKAEPIARPRACFRQVYIDDRSDYTITAEGVTLTSRTLVVNLDKVFRLFPFLATCGVELEEWAAAYHDPLQRYWAETIKELALFAALEALNHLLVERYALRRSSAMNPGSLEDWPIMQQVNLFQLLGELPDATGVRLTDSLLMVPTKSVSGVRFQATESFESCQLCPRVDCPGRKAPYDALLWQRKYEKHTL